MKHDADAIFNHFKSKQNFKYDEEKHCKLLINVMTDKNKGCHTFFCVEAQVSEHTFYDWVREKELFGSLYLFLKMVAKQRWYEEGKEISSKDYLMGTVNYEMDHWKLMGWAKFGISRNSRIRINFNPNDTPIKHFETILKQAANGDFTAAEFKQLMEAINVGLRVHEVTELQKQLDELKSDMVVMAANTNVQNPFANKGIEKKD
jgi:hypothetical protein